MIIKYLRVTLFTFLILGFLVACESKGDRFDMFEVNTSDMAKLPKQDVKNLDFSSEDRGLLQVKQDSILFTANGGVSATRALYIPSEEFKDFKLVTDSVAYVVGKNETVYKSVNGCKSWSEITVDVSGKPFTCIFATSPDTLFVTATGSGNNQGGVIARSSDGGAKWEFFTTPNDVQFITFYNAQLGFACGADGVLRSEDGGKTWEVTSRQAGHELLFITPDTGFLVSARSIFKTSDGGKNWTLLKTISNRQWVMGEDNSILRDLIFIHHTDLLFTLNSRLMKIQLKDNHWFQHDFTRPFIRLKMYTPSEGVVFGYEFLQHIQF